MKNKANQILTLLLACLVLIFNIILFYIPHIKSNYFISTTQNERFRIDVVGEDSLEIFWKNDFWKSQENRYIPLMEENTNRGIIYEKHWLTGQKEDVIEIVENADVMLKTRLKSKNNRDFSLQKTYVIKNEYLLEDIDTLYMRIIINSKFHSYTLEKNRLNFKKCNVNINKPYYLDMSYDYDQNSLTLSKKILNEMKYVDTYNINLDFSVDCE